jgi:hypothetical protein
MKKEITPTYAIDSKFIERISWRCWNCARAQTAMIIDCGNRYTWPKEKACWWCGRISILVKPQDIA